MNTLTTSIYSADGNVKIQWDEPDNNGESITAYKIEIQHKDGTTWIENLASCDGS
jgi:hypothetical protein